MKLFQIMAVSLLFAMSSCTTDDNSMSIVDDNVAKEQSKITALAATNCTNGLTYWGSFTNIGGNGGVSLTASATTLTGPGTTQNLTAGKLYRFSKSRSSLSVNNTFSIDTCASGDVYVRVIGISSNNAVVLMSAKKVSTNGNFYVRVCDTNAFSVYNTINFEIYSVTNSTLAWSFVQ